MDQIAAFDKAFPEDPMRQQRWKGFLNSKKASDTYSLTETLEELKTFLLPVIKAIQNRMSFQQEWHHTDRQWHRADDFKS